LFSSKSTQQWDQNINAIIILDNKHRFKEDPEYGKMHKKMWEGDLTLEDKQRINTRVIGFIGLELPSMLQGEYKIILVQNNGPKGHPNNLPQPAWRLSELFFWSDLS
jgi:hypothetical protein